MKKAGGEQVDKTKPPDGRDFSHLDIKKQGLGKLRELRKI